MIIIFNHQLLENNNNFGLKYLDETCGPYAFDCPESILNLLTPTDNEYANNWRKQCRERINSKIQLKHGNIIKLIKEVSFVDGAVSDTFKVYKQGKTTRFCRQFPDGSFSAPRYKIRAVLRLGAIYA